MRCVRVAVAVVLMSAPVMAESLGAARVAEAPSPNVAIPAKPPITKPAEDTGNGTKPTDHKTMAEAAIIAALIAASVLGYTGNCACPEYTDKAGHSCGRRAAYFKPGGYRPICYPAKDITPGMIARFRQTGNIQEALSLLVAP